jgi:hypothetical protein
VGPHHAGDAKTQLESPCEFGLVSLRRRRRETVPLRTAIITSLTASRPLCMSCVSTRAGLSVAEVEAVFRSIQEVVHRGDGRCRACGTVGPVYSVDDPAI